jgi:hypothetical protein
MHVNEARQKKIAADRKIVSGFICINVIHIKLKRKERLRLYFIKLTKEKINVFIVLPSLRCMVYPQRKSMHKGKNVAVGVDPKRFFCLRQ